MSKYTVDMPESDWGILQVMVGNVSRDTKEGRPWQAAAKRINAAIHAGIVAADVQAPPSRVEPHAVRLNDLAAALHRTEIHLGKLWEASGSTTGKAALWAARSAFADLRQQLTPEQDTEPAQAPAYRVTLRGGGAGTTDGPGEPGSVTITPAPGDGPDAPYRSGEPLTRTTVTCTCERIDVTESPAVPLYMPGRRDPFCDVHGYRDRGAAGIGLCGWRHPRWLNLYCTIRGDQYHVQHASHDRYGDLSWNPTLAAQGKLAEPAAKDWPAWTGNAL